MKNIYNISIDNSDNIYCSLEHDLGSNSVSIENFNVNKLIRLSKFINDEVERRSMPLEPSAELYKELYAKYLNYLDERKKSRKAFKQKLDKYNEIALKFFPDIFEKIEYELDDE